MTETKERESKENLGPIAFVPIIVFILIYLGGGIYYTVLGISDPFEQIPRNFALLMGIVCAWFMGKDKLDYKIDVFATAAGEPGVILMSLIFLFAGTFSGTARAMGADLAVVNFGLAVVPQQFIYVGVFIISIVLAIAMGTSLGTIAAVGPIAIGLTNAAQLDPAIAIAAVLGGATFGDNLSVISDTTIAATRGCGTQMADKFKMNAMIALPAAILSMICYSMVASSNSVIQVQEYSFVKMLPYIGVLITALMGVNVIVVLLGGTFFAGIIGIMTHSITLVEFTQGVANGMSNMFNLIIVTLLIRGLTGLAQEYGGVDWLIQLFTKNVKNRKHAEMSIFTLTGLIDTAVGASTIAILVAAPLVMPIAKKHNIEPKRVASLVDISACVFQSFLPHSSHMLLACAIADVSLFSVIMANYYPVILMVITLITIQFGLLKTKNEKEGISITYTV